MHRPHISYMGTLWYLKAPEEYPGATLKLKATYVLSGNNKVPSNATRGVVPGPCNRNFLLIPIVVLSLHLSEQCHTHLRFTACA